jgi:site-specific recombinase XerD
MCHRCWTRHPIRPITQAENLAAVLDDPPEWLIDFAAFAAERHCIERACVMVTAVGRLLPDGPCQPQALLERARRPGRSAGPLARTLEEFFVAERLAFGLDQEARLALGRRQRRVKATPETLQPAVAAFADHLVRSRERARRAGTHPRADNTIEQTLALVRDLASFVVTHRAKHDWSMVEVADVEAFLSERPANHRRRLQSSRQFFRWARKNKIVLVDPTRDLPSMPRRGFTGQTLTLSEQRRLFRRWTGHDVHPHEALVGILALLHAASSSEIRELLVKDFDEARQTLRVGRRPLPVPLDPASLTVLRRCLEQRASLGTRNPHVIVTKVTKPRNTPASTAYMSHVLDAAGVPGKRLRATRLVELVVTLDPKVVSEALGMKAEGLVDYLADHVDAGRLAEPGSANL